ncbi:hypothetical protein PA598K_01253 [Paenibacillus sp. 598K]|uniref:DUF4179 domain-containing protein n=1 Tax=Paenibacillus sp. 598K TaxID=1117987 RepID=UPI000FFAF4A7|nr:DUF4179 domain-containing protein [Paenibacillus sp. 598K]GBF72972.1 hypothetical protein PA598K_01253 [Paenibacillus sp. 598K]
MNRKELTSFFNEITPTDEQMRNMYAKINTYKEGEVPMNKTKKISVFAVVTAALLLFTTAAFASTLNWNELLIQHFKPSEDQINKMNDTVSKPEATVTNNGVTITVKQTIADSQNFYVLYEMTVPESIELNDDIVWGWSSLHLNPAPTNRDVSRSGTILKQDKHSRTVLLHWTLEVQDGAGTATLQFNDLTLHQKIFDKKGEYLDLKKIPLIEGEWQLTWDYKLDDTQSIKLEPNKSVSLKGSKNKIKKIVVSPLSVFVLIEGTDILTRVEPIVKFKDGSQLSFNYKSPGKSFSYTNVTHNDDQGNHLYYELGKIINPEDVESISIGNVTIPVTK